MEKVEMWGWMVEGGDTPPPGVSGRGPACAPVSCCVSFPQCVGGSWRAGAQFLGPPPPPSSPRDVVFQWDIKNLLV